MPIRQSPLDLAREDVRRLVAKIAGEVVAARKSLGLSQRTVAKAAGISRTQLGRLERGALLAPTIDLVCAVARVLGLEVSLGLFPAGTPVRDAPHLALLARFEALLGALLRMRREVPLPIPGDRRAWDAAIMDANEIAFAEGETHLGDMQALGRRVELKLRDDPRSPVVILVVARTRHNEQVLREHRETLRALLPLDGAAIAKHLRAGRIPPASGIIVL
jgi:transcriptional regulator with XRE-family HTH domain